MSADGTINPAEWGDEGQPASGEDTEWYSTEEEEWEPSDVQEFVPELGYFVGVWYVPDKS